MLSTTVASPYQMSHTSSDTAKSGRTFSKPAAMTWMKCVKELILAWDGLLLWNLHVRDSRASGLQNSPLRTISSNERLSAHPRRLSTTRMPKMTWFKSIGRMGHSARGLGLKAVPDAMTLTRRTAGKKLISGTKTYGLGAKMTILHRI